MKILILFLLSLNALASDLDILKENIQRINSMMNYYPQEVHPLLERYLEQETVIYSTDERKIISDFWTLYNDARITLETLAASYRETDPLIVYSAKLHIQNSAAQLSQKLWNNPKARKKLNETNQSQIPRGSFINLENTLFKSHLSLETELPSFFPTSSLSKDRLAVARIDGFTQDIDLHLLNEAAEKELKNFREFLNSTENYKEVKKRFHVYKFKNLFYTLVKKIATWLGDTKVRNRNPDYYNGQTLINIELAKQMQKKVLPGDIMLSRTDWFLSNMFLPGFWSHSFLYLGEVNELKNYFQDIKVSDFYQEKCKSEGLTCQDFLSYLSASPRTKSTFAEYLKKDKYGFPMVLLEATSDGVHFSSIRKTFLNDYLAALRPKISKLEKAQTIEESLSFYAFAYDYDFDYSTDDRVVCSELVGKAFDGKVEFNYDIDRGKYIELIAGRPSIPVRNIITKFYDENISRIRPSQLDFVAFLKGFPKKKTAKFMSEKDLLATKDKAKWEFMH